MMTSPPPPIALFKLSARPEWGHCLIVAERDNKVFLQCEDGAEHALAASFRSKLEPVTLDEEETAKVAGVIQGHGVRRAAVKAKRPVKKRPAGPAAPRLTFDQQLERFHAKFPGGFAGEAFIAEERGAAGSDDKGSKDAAIARARELLSAAALGQPDAYDKATSLFATTDLVHPMEGSIPFRSMAEENRPTFVAALRDLLHGSGDYAARFDAFVASVKLAAADGTQKRASWPVTTLFAGLLQSNEQVFVKPKLLLEQAAILNATVEYDSSPSGRVYEQFRALLRSVDAQLRERGLAPRDLLDTAAFVWSTLGRQPAAEVAVAPPVA